MFPWAAHEKAPHYSVGDLIQSYRAAKLLFTAARLDVFTKLENRALTPSELARRVGCRHRPTAVFLDALAALGFLRKKDGRFSNTHFSRQFLMRRSPQFLGDNLTYQDKLWQAWGDLEDVLRTDKPQRSLGALLGDGPGFTESYIRGMENIARRPASELAGLVAGPAPTSMLDVGAGSGAYAAAFLRAHPELEATLLDLPGTLKMTRRMMAAQPPALRKRVRYQAGDYHRAAFGNEAYDLILLSHVTHDEGEEENIRLLEKARRALKPGGRVVVHDFMTGPDGTSPLFSVLFSAHMLVYTSRGKVYSVEEYSAWLRRLGFRLAQRLEIGRDAPNASQALVAVRTA